MRKVTRAIIAVLCVVLCMSVFFACDNTPEHEHDYKLKSNDTEHWYECEADGDVKADSKANHVDENRDGKCDVCQYDKMLVTNLKGISFDISGKDGSEDVDLNGTSVTITYKNHTHTATVANGKFTIAETELVYLGTYTVSADGYWDGSVQITKNGASAVVLNKIHNVEQSVRIDYCESVPTLIVEGMIPTDTEQEIGCVKLHYDANSTDYYVENTSQYAGAYHFALDLSTLPLTNTPYCWFHIYCYAEENPTANSQFVKVDLERGDVLNVNDTLDYNGVTYTVKQNDDSKQLIVQPTPTISIESIAFDVSKGKPELVVKGTVSKHVGNIKIHINANRDADYYGDNVSTDAGKYECRFDFSEVVNDQLTETPWCWFHLYMYSDANPASDKLSTPDYKLDIARGSYFEAGNYVDYNGVRYEVQNQGQLVIQPKVVSDAQHEIAITNIGVDTTNGKPILVVKATTDSAILCAKLHADGNDTNWYGDAKTVTAAGEFELTFDLTQLTTQGTPWCFFHIYAYNDANPTEETTFQKVDIKNEGSVSVPGGTNWTCDGVVYTVITGEGTWGCFIIQPTNA